MKILIVDDDQLILDMLEDYLSKFYEVITFSSSVKALIHYSENMDYAVVLTGYVMPKMNGYELIEQVLKLNGKQKVIICTSTLNRKLFELSERYSDQIYLCNKPFDLEKLNELIASTQEAK